MANWQGHLVGGVAAGFAVSAALVAIPIGQMTEATHILEDWQAAWAVFVLSMLFALFPDVDTNSKAQDIFFALAFGVDILLLASGNIQAAAYLGFIAMLPILGHHRGWTHSRWAMLLVPLPILIVPYLYNPQALSVTFIYYLSAVAGYASHLLLDGLIVRQIRFKG